DAAIGVHDAEREDLRGSGLAVRAALPGELRTRAVARSRRAPGPASTEEEPARPHCVDRGSAELLVRIGRVPARAVVEDDAAGHEGDVHPARRVAAPLEELRSDAGRSLEPIERTAGEADRVYRIQVLPVHAGRSAAHVDRQRRDLRQVKDGAACRTFVVLGDTDLETRKVELEHAALGELRPRYEPSLVVRRLRSHSGTTSIAKM